MSEHKCGCGGGCSCGGHGHGAKPAPQPISNPIELLESQHDFPCDFSFKVVGFNGDGFEDDLRQALKELFGEEHASCTLRSKASSGGKYLSFSLEAPARSGAHVLEIYDGLRKIPGLVMLV